MKFVLIQHQSPGDIVCITPLIRDIKKQYPECQIMVNTSCDDVFINNPHVSLFDAEIKDEILLDYPDVHKSNELGIHFSQAFYNTFRRKTNLQIEQTSIYPEIFVSDGERKKFASTLSKYGVNKRFWILNAGYKDDYPLKDWGYARYCEVVDRLKKEVQFIQVGELNPRHTHEHIPGTIDLIGRTTLREYLILASLSSGSLGPVSVHMHVQAAFRKPCVVVAGGREPHRWESYPNHRYLHTCGLLPCCEKGGCWIGKIYECFDYTPTGPKCHTMITPKQVSKEILNYEKY